MFGLNIFGKKLDKKVSSDSCLIDWKSFLNLDSMKTCKKCSWTYQNCRVNLSATGSLHLICYSFLGWWPSNCVARLPSSDCLWLKLSPRSSSMSQSTSRKTVCSWASPAKKSIRLGRRAAAPSCKSNHGIDRRIFLLGNGIDHHLIICCISQIDVVTFNKCNFLFDSVFAALTFYFFFIN